jgi:UDP-glucuronate 4-epimerase
MILALSWYTLSLMRYFITGAAGFIGSHVCEGLVKNGNQVLAIDNFSNSYNLDLKFRRVEALLKPVELQIENLDISNFEQVNLLIKSFKPDIVVNLAAQAGVRASELKINSYIQSNIIGFTNVLRATINNEVPYFVYASSSSVYGDKSKIPFLESEINLRPTSFYGVTKFANELITQTLISQSSTAARGLRFFTVYGPWGRPDMAYFRLIVNTILDREFDLYGDGTVERDFTFISDVVDSTILLSKELQTRDAKFNDVVNIGGGKPFSMNDLINTVGKELRTDVKVRMLDKDLNDALKTMANFEYLNSLIGLKPETSLEYGLKKTIEWALSSNQKRSLDSWIS